jgi:kinesin family protein 11
MFEKMMEQLEAQKAEVNHLRSQLQEVNRQAIEANQSASSKLQQALEEEREQAEADRADLLSQIKLLIADSGQKQNVRLKSRVDDIRSDMASSGETLEEASNMYEERMDEWARKEDLLIEEVTSSRDSIKTRMQNDWTVRFHVRRYIDELLTSPGF